MLLEYTIAHVREIYVISKSFHQWTKEVSYFSVSAGFLKTLWMNFTMKFWEEMHLHTGKGCVDFEMAP